MFHQDRKYGRGGRGGSSTLYCYSFLHTVPVTFQLHDEETKQCLDYYIKYRREYVIVAVFYRSYNFSGVILLQQPEQTAGNSKCLILNDFDTLNIVVESCKLNYEFIQFSFVFCCLILSLP